MKSEAYPFFKPEARQDDWVTPHDFYRKCLERWPFTLDAAAGPTNFKCPRYYTEDDNGLVLPWETWTWCNPPYSDILPWFQKAHTEALKGRSSVLLTFSRTDTRAFHRYATKAAEVVFLQGRIAFLHPDTGEAQDPAPSPSMLVVFDAKDLGAFRATTMSAKVEPTLELFPEG